MQILLPIIGISTLTREMIRGNNNSMMQNIVSILLLAFTTIIHAVSAAQDTTTLTMDVALDYAWTAFKVIFACSPIIAIIAILALAREDEEEEAAKRKIKCARS